jgi:hypothetical protein
VILAEDRPPFFTVIVGVTRPSMPPVAGPGGDVTPRLGWADKQRPVAPRTPLELPMTSAPVLAPTLGHHLRTGRPPDPGTFAHGPEAGPALAWTWRKGWMT